MFHEKITCKNCQSEKVVKNGFVRNKQRYKCKKCGCNFVPGDARTFPTMPAMKALCVLLYTLGKGSYGMLGKLLDRDRSLIYRWLREAGMNMAEPEIKGDITEIEFDEMWHFIQKKTTSFGSSRPLTVVQGELSPGFSVIVMLQRFSGFMTK